MVDHLDAFTQLHVDYSDLLTIAGDIVSMGQLSHEDLARLRAHCEGCRGKSPRIPPGWAILRSGTYNLDAVTVVSPLQSRLGGLTLGPDGLHANRLLYALAAALLEGFDHG